MGLTPLEGLVMGTRSGDMDPAIMEYIAKKEDLDIAGVMNVLNKKSGVLGLSKNLSSDFRDLEEGMNNGNKYAKAAMEVFCYRVAKYIGSYVAAMNGVDAIAFTELGSDNCPNGTIASVVGTPFDLRTARPLEAGWDADHPQIRQGSGYDHNWALRGTGLRRAAVLAAPESGIVLTLSTTQPGLQVYTGNFLPEAAGKGGVRYAPRCGVALEAQGFPNAVNQPVFPSAVLRAGERYRQEIAFAFGHD